jgi:hypothetical protein
MPLNIEFEPTRRRFLGTAAGFAAVAALKPTLPTSASGTPARKAPADEWPITEPYPPLNGGRFSGPRVGASDDPLVRYRWADPQAGDGLQVYQLRPVAVDTDQPGSFQQLGSAATPNCNIAVVGRCRTRPQRGQGCLSASRAARR